MQGSEELQIRVSIKNLQEVDYGSLSQGTVLELSLSFLKPELAPVCKALNPVRGAAGSDVLVRALGLGGMLSCTAHPWTVGLRLADFAG